MMENSPLPNFEEIVSRLKQVLNLDKVVKVFYVDDTIGSTGFDLEKVIFALRESLGNLKKDDRFTSIFGSSIDFSIDDDQIVFGQVEQLLRNDETTHKELYTFLFPGEPLEKTDIDDDLRRLFDGIDFDSFHPEVAVDRIHDFVRDHNEGTIVFLFDFEFGDEMNTRAIRNGGDLILRICRDFPDKVNNMTFAIISHFVKQGEEIEKRDKFINGGLELLKPIPFLLSKTRKENPLLLADGIKKALLNKLVEDIKSKTLSVLEDAFDQTKLLLSTLDTYEFEHIVVKSSLTEGIWMGKTIRRLSTVLFENSINSKMIEKDYLKTVNPIFESIIDYSRIQLITKSEDKPYNNRKLLRFSELYVKGDDINRLYEPVANGDIFEIQVNNSTPGATAQYILLGQDCDITLRSTGERNRSQRFVSMLAIKTEVKTDLDQKIVEYSQKFKDTNYLMASKYLLPYYKPEDFTKVGVVNFNNELIVYIDVLDLVSINNTGEAKYDKDIVYPVSEFSHSLMNRYNELRKICTKFNREITGINSGITNLSGAVKEKIQSKFIKTISPFGEGKGTKNPHIADGKFDFGIRRIARLRKEHAASLLSKYTQFTSRVAHDHDFALEGES